MDMRLNLLYKKAEEAILEGAKISLQSYKGGSTTVVIALSKNAKKNWMDMLDSLEATEEEREKASLFFNTARKKLVKTIVDFTDIPYPYTYTKS